MQYFDGLDVRLGDVVSVPVPRGEAIAKVVMLGDSREHLELEASFLKWMQTGDVLGAHSVVIEWVGANPFAHDDPAYAPVGNYMTATVDEWLEFKARSAA